MPEHTIADASLPSLLTVGCANFEAVPRNKAATLDDTQSRVQRDTSHSWWLICLTHDANMVGGSRLLKDKGLSEKAERLQTFVECVGTLLVRGRT